MFYVSVLDMNDNPPKLEKNVYTSLLSEEALRNQFVTIVTASDPDSVDHRRLSYSIVGGNQQQTFTMDASTGMFVLPYSSSSNIVLEFSLCPNILIHIDI